MQIQEITTRLNKTIKRKLEDRNLRQKEYAKKLHMNPSTLSNYITGTREMSYEVISIIAEDLDLDLNYIFKYSEIQNYSLDDEEVEFILSLCSLKKRDRKEIFNSIKTLLDYRTAPNK